MNTPEISLFKEILSVVETGGPWTVIVVLGYVIRVLYTKIDTILETHRQIMVTHAEEKQKLNDRIIAMAEKQNDLLERSANNQTLLLEAMNAPREVREARELPEGRRR